MMTLIKNMGLIVSDDHVLQGEEGQGPELRWMMPTEALVAQGFPVHPVIHMNQQLCSFAMVPPRPRKPRLIFQQVGDAMHVHTVLVVLLHSYIAVRRTDSHALFRSLAAIQRQEEEDKEDDIPLVQVASRRRLV